MRNAVRSAPVVSPLRSQILKQASSVPEPVVYQNSQGTKGLFCNEHYQLLLPCHLLGEDKFLLVSSLEKTNKFPFAR